MSTFFFLKRAGLKLAIACVLLLGTFPAFADAPLAVTTTPPSPPVQVFPPETMSNANCGAAPAGFTYSLVWDGQTNVRCSLLPTTCAAGQGLQYEATAGQFICVTVCSGPTSTQKNTGTCPSGQIGSIYDNVVTQCDGSVTTIPTNTCGYPMNATVSTQCTPGSTLVGYIDATGNFNQFCGPTTHACQNFTCGATGPVLQ